MFVSMSTVYSFVQDVVRGEKDTRLCLCGAGNVAIRTRRPFYGCSLSTQNIAPLQTHRERNCHHDDLGIVFRSVLLIGSSSRFHCV